MVLYRHYEYSCLFFFSSRRRHTRYWRDWSSDVCSSDLTVVETRLEIREGEISRQVDVVVGRDGRSREPEQPAERDRDRPAPNGESSRGALDPKVRELLDLKADAPPIGTVPVETMREETPAQMAELFRRGLVSKIG